MSLRCPFFGGIFLALSCSEPPEGFACWSLRLLADKAVELNNVASISHKAVRQALKNEIKPWKFIGWVIPPEQNGEFVVHMKKVLDVYCRLYNPDCHNNWLRVHWQYVVLLQFFCWVLR